MKKNTSKRKNKNKKKNGKSSLIYFVTFAIVVVFVAIFLVAIINNHQETHIGEVEEYWDKIEKIDPELFHFEIIAKDSDDESSRLKIKFRDIVFDQVCVRRHESDVYTPMMNCCTITSSTGEEISKYSLLSSSFEEIIWYLHKDQVLALSDKYPKVIKMSEYPGFVTDSDSSFVVEDESELKSFINDVLEIEDYSALYKYFKSSYKTDQSSSRIYDYSNIWIDIIDEPRIMSQTIFEWAFNNK